MSYLKCLYVGSGIHIEPVKELNHIKEFVFIDCQPRTEYGFRYYYRAFYRENFMDELMKKCVNFNFHLVDTKVFTENFTEINVPYIESMLLHFFNKETEQTLKYYISTSLPYEVYDNEILQKDISECDNLIIAGHLPDDVILEYIKKPITLFGYSNTVYPSTIKEYYDNFDEGRESLVLSLIHNIGIFHKFLYVDKSSGSITECTNYSELLSQSKKCQLM